MKRALVNGSFDPITFGHIDIISRVLNLFDEVIVGIGVNINKSYLLSAEDRLKLITEIFEDSKNIKVISYNGLTIDVVKDYDIDFIVRGVRNSAEYELESQMAAINNKLCGVETLLLPSSPELCYLSSTFVREINAFSHDISKFVPENVARKLKEK